MNRRSFFQLVTGFAAGMVAAFAPKTKATWAEPGMPERKGTAYPALNSGSTLNWIHVGPYKDSNCIQVDCCYTHKNGKKMRCCVLFEIDSIEGDLKHCDEQIRKRAIEEGAWYPTKDTKYFIS